MIGLPADRVVCVVVAMVIGVHTICRVASLDLNGGTIYHRVRHCAALEGPVAIYNNALGPKGESIDSGVEAEHAVNDEPVHVHRHIENDSLPGRRDGECLSTSVREKWRWWRW